MTCRATVLVARVSSSARLRRRDRRAGGDGGRGRPASAHPLGNFTVNRAIRVDIGSGVSITAVLDLAEIPAFEIIRDVDTDGDELLSPAEGDPYAEATCATWAPTWRSGSTARRLRSSR